VVASRTGTKYYFEWCEGADALSLKNKITFQSPEEAEIAGYELASNCGS